jgi:acyl-coenzyme A thioesterase PaaI-like protein
VSAERLAHHELCFGCGQTNLFGLLMEVERVGDGSVRGRAFVKQDHQGPERGVAHEGIVLAALSDAMALACGPNRRATHLELEVHAPVPVGAFLDVEAQAAGPDQASANARVEAQLVATAHGMYRLG